MTLIIYGSKEKLSAYHQAISLPNGRNYFVRIDESPLDLLDALEVADRRKMEGETVLNTVEISNL